MSVDMRAYDDIVDKALDVSRKHNEDERTEEEVQSLLGRMDVTLEDDALRAVVRYVNLSNSRHADSMRNLGF